MGNLFQFQKELQGSARPRITLIGINKDEISQPMPLYEGKVEQSPKTMFAGHRRLTRLLGTEKNTDFDAEYTFCQHEDISDWKCSDCSRAIP